jgi:hypothetical protein
MADEKLDRREPGYHVLENLRQSNDRLHKLSGKLRGVSKRLQV